MPTLNQEHKVAILKELQKYKADELSMKPLFESMKEFTAWLKTKEK